jgi:hypothetical protein
MKDIKISPWTAVVVLICTIVVMFSVMKIAKAQDVESPNLLPPMDFRHTFFAKDPVALVEFEWHAAPATLNDALNPVWVPLQSAQAEHVPLCYTSDTWVEESGYVRIRYRSTEFGDPSPWSNWHPVPEPPKGMAFGLLFLALHRKRD